MRRIVFAVAVVLAACVGEHKAYVECAGAAGGFGCTVTHQQGGNPINACWAVSVECTNHLKTKAKSCQVVQPSGKAVKVVPYTDFPKGDQCDAVSAIAVTDVSLKIVE